MPEVDLTHRPSLSVDSGGYQTAMEVWPDCLLLSLSPWCAAFSTCLHCLPLNMLYPAFTFVEGYQFSHTRVHPNVFHFDDTISRELERCLNC